MNEFDLIGLIGARAPRRADVVVGIGDDAAVLQPAAGMQLVATTDHLVAGRHFLASGEAAATPAEIGHLALAVNLSDLAAMGAAPRWCLLGLTLPEADSAWLDGFLDGFLALAERHGCALVGGNLARGALNIGVTALGEVGAGCHAGRCGARAGQRIVVTGTLGDAAAGLRRGAPRGSMLRQRLLRPTPRVAAGQTLAPRASALIDISDGLAADLGHLLGDRLGAEIRLDRLPVSPALAEAEPDPAARAALQLAGGDYELLAVLADDAPLPECPDATAMHEIGWVTERPGIDFVDARGCRVEMHIAGWDHFGPGDAEPGRGP